MPQAPRSQPRRRLRRVLREAVDERSRTELTLREAIDSDGLRLHFQPEVDLRTGRVLAVEALVRWTPDRAAPGVGLHRGGRRDRLVVDMGRWSLKKRVANWPNGAGLPDCLGVRVNMSPPVRHQRAGRLRRGLHAPAPDPGDRLCIEITNTPCSKSPTKRPGFSAASRSRRRGRPR